MAEKKITVFIYLVGEPVAVPAGIFTYDHDLQVGTFDYGRKYLERRNALAVDPAALPLGLPSRAVTTNKGLYGAFRDGAPDYWGRLVMAAERSVPPEALSEIDFLLDGNATRVGNLDFRLTPHDPEPSPGPPHFDRMEEIMAASSRIEAGLEVSGHLLRLLRQGTSVGGARPKCTVEWQEALWIAKFPARGDTVNIPRIEYAAMTLAGKCGIRIPTLHLQSLGDLQVLLVRRFDREKTPAGWVRKGFLSSLSLLQWDEADRLQWDYGAIAGTMRRYTSIRDIQELFRRMVFNILVRNTDDHPRNHGFLFSGYEMELSPAYDIVPSMTYPGLGTAFFLAMSVGDRGREASLENALSQAGRFGLTGTEAQSMIEQIAITVSGWREHFTSAGCPETELRALEPSFAVSGNFP
jgi:serine/threonine-protein kinase HipA